MKYAEKNVSKTTKILFPIFITAVAGIFAPRSVALVGFLMFGNLIRECGVLDGLSETAQKVLANLITLLLGLTVATRDAGRHLPERADADDPWPWPGRLHLRHGGRRFDRQAVQPVRQGEDQTR